MIGQDRSGQVRSVQVRTVQDRSGKVRKGQDSSGQALSKFRVISRSCLIVDLETLKGQPDAHFCFLHLLFANYISSTFS